MTSEIRLDHRALEAYLPHRGVNMMPDEVVISADGRSSTSRTRIPAGDPRGRGLFARKGAAVGPVWQEPFLCELLALTGVPLLTAKLAPLGQVAVFSTVARLEMPAVAPLGGVVLGATTMQRERGGFSQFAGEIRLEDGTLVMSAEFMSGAAALADIARGVARPLEAAAVRPLAGDFAWKDAATRFLDGVTAEDAAAGRLTGCYRFPPDHPLVPGHFPGAPLLMGMAQWTAVADAAWELAARLGRRGRLVVDGALRRPDGTEIFGVRGLTVDCDGAAPRLLAAKRLAFREPVRPGDGVLVEVAVAA